MVHWSELEMIRALLVDDQPQILEGLEMLLALESDVTIVGTAQTAQEAIALAHALQPDIIVMDVRLPGIDGIAATRALGQDLPSGKVVILSLYCDPETRRLAAEAGAQAFVAKHDMTQSLLATIRQVAAQTKQSVGEIAPQCAAHHVRNV
ncbi:MAG TPA: response regulator transcription factor [Thermomicrobiales bacterium]|nr:response regulator transcription factor [Thermomicrobiales bacterium]